MRVLQFIGKGVLGAGQLAIKFPKTALLFTALTTVMVKSPRARAAAQSTIKRVGETALSLRGSTEEKIANDSAEKN